MANPPDPKILYNTKTRLPEAVPEDQLAQAIASGTHSYQVGKRINIIGPGGQIHNVDSSELAGAIQEGWLPETTRQAAVREYVDENKGLKGAAKVGLGQFADEALLSIPETVYDLTADPLEVAKKEALKKEHSIANTLGGIGGFGASMFVGGPLFKAAEVAGHGAERLALGGVEEAAVRGAEGAGKSVADRTLEGLLKDRAAETVTGGGTERAAEAAAGVEPRTYAPFINPDAGLTDLGAKADGNIFDREYMATQGTPDAAIPGPTEIGSGQPGGAIDSLNPNSSVFERTPLTPEDLRLQGGRSPGQLPPGPSTELGFPDLEGEVVPPSGAAPGQLPPGPSTSLGFPDMEGHVVPPPGQIAPPEVPGLAEPGIPGIGSGAGEGRLPPIKLGALDTKQTVTAGDSLLNNTIIDGSIPGIGMKGQPLLAPAAQFVKKGITNVAEVGAEEAQAKAIFERLVATGVPTAEAAKMAPSLARKVFASALNQGVQAGVIAAPKAIVEGMLGDPNEAAEHFAMQVGFGGVLGAAGKLATEGISKLAPRFGDIAEEQAFRNLMSSRNLKATKQAMQIQGGVKGVGRALLDENLIKGVGEEWEQYASRITERKDQVGSEIGNLYTGLDDINAGQIKTTSTDELANLFEQKVVKPLSKIPGNEGVISKVQKYIDSFRTIGEDRNLSLTEMHNWRQTLDKLIWNEGQIGITDKAKQQLQSVRSLLSDEMETTGQKISEKFAKGDFRSQLKDKNLLFRKLKVAEDTALHSSAQDVANRNVSPSDYMAGIAGAASGHGVLGLGLGLAHHWIKENGNSIASRTLDGMSTARVKGVLMAEQALKRSATSADEIPATIAGKILDGAKSGIATAHLSAINRFIGVRHENQSLSEQYDEMHKKLTYLMNNPSELQANIGDVTGHLSNGGAPNIAGASATKYNQVLGYINNVMPRPQMNPNPYEPKSVQQAKGMIGEGELQNFAKRIAVINDPFLVFRKIGQGTLTQGEVDTMRTIYPALYQRGLERIQANPQSLSYAQRANVDLYAHANITDSQGASVPPASAQAAEIAAGGKGKKGAGVGKLGMKFDIAPNAGMTQVQSLFARKGK